tara:strand:- start:327 stop:1010 length:684 start_codon:yes stop_codon:yes gene_type:complete
MKSQNSRSYLALFLLLILPSFIYFYVTRGFNNFIELEFVGNETHVISDFSFVNQNNKLINNTSMRGNIYVANFFFTSCPKICPNMIKNMAYVQKELSIYPAIRFLSHTVDPQNDTPERFLEYIENMRSNNIYIDTTNWDFVTGKRTDLYSIASSYLAESPGEDALEEGGFFHSQAFILIDKEGRIRSGIDKDNNPVGFYDGRNELQMKDLVDDIKVLMAEYNKPKKK